MCHFINWHIFVDKPLNMWYNSRIPTLKEWLMYQIPYKLVTLGRHFVTCVAANRESVTLHVDHPVTQRAIRALSKHLKRYVECVVVGTSGAEAVRVKVQNPKFATDTERKCLAVTYITQPLFALTDESSPNDVLNAQLSTTVPWQRDYVHSFQIKHLGFVRE